MEKGNRPELSPRKPSSSVYFQIILQFDFFLSCQAFHLGLLDSFPKLVGAHDLATVTLCEPPEVVASDSTRADHNGLVDNWT